MKTTNRGFIIPVIIFIIAVLAIGSGAYVYSKNHSGKNPNTVTTSENINVKAGVVSTTTSNKSAAFTKVSVNTSVTATPGLTFSEITHSGKNQVCQGTTIAYPLSMILHVSGSSYQSEGFNSRDNTVPHFYTIQKDGYVWSWNSISNDGFKGKISVSASSPKMVALNQKIEGQLNYNFTCSDWIPNSAEFLPPTNITFQEITAN